MKRICRLASSFAALSMLLTVLSACGKADPGASASVPSAEPAARAADEAPKPYTYPAPVSGRYSEVNIGDLEFVDGIAWAPNGAGETVVYVTDKSIASPVLGARCPVSEARSLSVLRNAGWNEIAVDADDRSEFFGAGHPFDGTSRSRDVGGREWKISRSDTSADRIAGRLKHKYYGAFEFDLPVRRPEVREISENERMDGGLDRADGPTADPAALAATYEKLRKTALAKDLRGFLAAQGFGAEQIAAIRGLAGIDADFERNSLRFLAEATTDEPEARAGVGMVGANGANAKGEKFANYYYFVSCGDRLLLAQIAENPQ
jgi:hypothetical protein